MTDSDTQASATRRWWAWARASVLAASLVITGAPVLAQDDQSGAASEPSITVQSLRQDDRTDTYRRLIALAPQMPADFDFTALRMAFVRTPYYRPFDTAIQARLNGSLVRLRDATRGGVSWQEARESLTEVCRALLADITVQRTCYAAADHNMGQRDIERDRTFHRWVIGGLLASIRGSGDGSTPETALQVISLAEMRFTIQSAGLRLRERWAVPADMVPPGSVVHMAMVANDESNSLRLFFDVSYPAAFAPPPPQPTEPPTGGAAPADDG